MNFMPRAQNWVNSFYIADLKPESMCSWILEGLAELAHVPYPSHGQQMRSSCGVRVDDIHKRRLQAGTTNQEAIDIGLLGQFARVLLRNTTTVQDPRLLSGFRRYLLLQPFSDSSVDLLCLLSGSDLAGSNGPAIK